jgi:hypothetical protein
MSQSLLGQEVLLLSGSAWSVGGKNNSLAGHWWLTPVILTTQEAEFRRIAAQSQPWANSSRDPTKNPSQKRAGEVAQS